MIIARFPSLIPAVFQCWILPILPHCYICVSVNRSPDVRHTDYYWSAPHTIATPEILIVPSFLQLCRPAVGDSWCCTACHQLHLYQLILQKYIFEVSRQNELINCINSIRSRNAAGVVRPLASLCLERDDSPIPHINCATKREGRKEGRYCQI